MTDHAMNCDLRLWLDLARRSMACCAVMSWVGSPGARLDDWRVEA
jgi:hypothetical protein